MMTDTKKMQAFHKWLWGQDLRTRQMAIGYATLWPGDLRETLRDFTRMAGASNRPDLEERVAIIKAIAPFLDESPL